MFLKYSMPFLHRVAQCVTASAASHHQEPSEMQNLRLHSVPGNQDLHASAIPKSSISKGKLANYCSVKWQMDLELWPRIWTLARNKTSSFLGQADFSSRQLSCLSLFCWDVDLENSPGIHKSSLCGWES